jgi:hypothetical protein
MAEGNWAIGKMKKTIWKIGNGDEHASIVIVSPRGRLQRTKLLKR